jgi:MFS family permease
VAQLTVTAYIAGLAFGQLVIGAASDGTGRRTPLLCSTAAFMTTCVICAIAPNAGLLIAARLLGGLAAGAGVATGRAVVSDYYEGNAAAKKFGTLASINFLGPVVAPAIGGLILTVGTWRTIFWSLSGLGVVMFVAVAARLPETLPPSERHRGGVTATWARMVDLLGTSGLPAARHRQLPRDGRVLHLHRRLVVRASDRLWHQPDRVRARVLRQRCRHGRRGCALSRARGSRRRRTVATRRALAGLDRRRLPWSDWPSFRAATGHLS